MVKKRKMRKAKKRVNKKKQSKKAKKRLKFMVWEMKNMDFFNIDDFEDAVKKL